jgi:peptidyl-prolyl cis-trans isomerase C
MPVLLYWLDPDSSLTAECSDPTREEKKIMRRARSINCSILFLSLLVTAVPAGQTQAEDKGVAAAGKVAARVNGLPIYEERVNAEIKKAGGTFRTFGVRKEDPDLIRPLQLHALDTIIDEEVLAQESRKLKVDDIEQKVDQELKAIETKHGVEGGIERYMKQRSLTMDDLRKAARVSVCSEEYLKKQGILEPQIPEDRIRKMYQENPGSYRREETVKISHVLISVDEHAEAATKKKARQEADSIRSDILQGKDFAEIAKTHSDCNSAAGGGDLGFIKKGYMPKEFDKVAFALEKGAVSEVLQTKFGYHIIKVVDKKPAGVAPYEEVRDFIRKYLQSQDSRRKLAEHIAELRKNSKIEILLK